MSPGTLAHATDCRSSLSYLGQSCGWTGHSQPILSCIADRQRAYPDPAIRHVVQGPNRPLLHVRAVSRDHGSLRRVPERRAISVYR